MNSKAIFYSFSFLFALLYLCVAATSTYHAISLFQLANTFGWACLLAGTFEIANMAVTVMLLDSVAKKKQSKIMPWIMLSFTTFVQILGNIYATTNYMVKNSGEGLKFFTDYLLFFLNNPDEKTNILVVALLIGAGLPLLALGLTAMVVNMIESRKQTISPEKASENVRISPEKASENVRISPEKAPVYIDDDPKVLENEVDKVWVPDAQSLYHEKPQVPRYIMREKSDGEGNEFVRNPEFPWSKVDPSTGDFYPDTEDPIIPGFLFDKEKQTWIENPEHPWYKMQEEEKNSKHLIGVDQHSTHTTNVEDDAIIAKLPEEYNNGQMKETEVVKL